jgi:uncharacterized membrane protein
MDNITLMVAILALGVVVYFVVFAVVLALLVSQD